MVMNMKIFYWCQVYSISLIQGRSFGSAVVSTEDFVGARRVTTATNFVPFAPPADVSQVAFGFQSSEQSVPSPHITGRRSSAAAQLSPEVSNLSALSNGDSFASKVKNGFTTKFKKRKSGATTSEAQQEMTPDLRYGSMWYNGKAVVSDASQGNSKREDRVETMEQRSAKVVQTDVRSADDSGESTIQAEERPDPHQDLPNGSDEKERVKQTSDANHHVHQKNSIPEVAGLEHSNGQPANVKTKDLEEEVKSASEGRDDELEAKSAYQSVWHDGITTGDGCKTICTI